MIEQNEKQKSAIADVMPAQPGEKLRQAREACGLSVADVAVRLKLSTDKINALECGDITGLATPVFVAGYIRTYARLLGISEAEVLADFDEFMPVQESEDDPSLTVNEEAYGKVAREISNQFSLREKSTGNNLGIIGLAAAILIALAYVLWPAGEVVQKNTIAPMSSSGESNSVTQLPETTITTTDVAADITTEKSMDDAPAVENQDLAAEQIDEGESSNAVMPAAEPEPASEPELESTRALEPVPSGMKSELILSFNGDSWAEVQDARGQRLVYRLGKSGERRVVTGVAPFVVQLGFVQGVDIFYNGAPYDLSRYANRRSVRLRIGETGDHMSAE